MNRKARFAGLALVVAIGAKAQSDIKIGTLDPPALDGLKGEMGCIAYHLEDSCHYVLGDAINGPERVVVLKEFQRRLESGRAQYLIIDLVKVPAEFAGALRFLGCRYDGDEMQAMVAAVSVTGDPGDLVGPADWVVIVDWEEKKLVSGDPLSVECWIDDF
jgi:hypothetical protein